METKDLATNVTYIPSYFYICPHTPAINITCDVCGS